MPKLGYSHKVEDEEDIAKATGRSLRVSPKWSIELARELREKWLEDAKGYVMEIIDKKRSLPLKKFKKGVAHRGNLDKAYAGRYPQKVARHFLKVLESAENNAEYKGLNTERLFVKHINAQRGQAVRGMRPRAYGRATPKNQTTTHLQVILEER